MLRAIVILLLVAAPITAQDLSDVKITLKGTVTGPDGKPLKGATVKAVPWGDTHRISWPQVDKAAAVAVKKDGTFWLEQERKKWLVVAAAPRHAELALILPAKDRLDIAFKLPKAQKIAGVVTDDRRKAIRGASLVLLREDESLDGPIPRDGLKAESDKRGRFAFERLAPGKYRINARVRGKPVEYLRDVEAGTTKLKVTICEGKPIRGRVVDKAGKPVRGVMIQVHSDKEIVYGKTTDAEGRFVSVPLHPGRTYRISVDPRGKGPTPPDVKGVKPGGKEITIRLK